ncbi:hypothetical protein MtrunA17_Chr4g0021171 [Medicago truncatula]|uniref:Uncharacterized protein n=1 Tax=Medicago truncatula TaxID=3880 RepID=A0A396IB56_MEDTR|nr:hypothetical protein MtrunA17_Chr4g0021171 [Medicago truncatula]
MSLKFLQWKKMETVKREITPKLQELLDQSCKNSGNFILFS